MPQPAPLTLDYIRRRMTGHAPDLLPAGAESGMRAAVALVLAGPPDALSACFIHRATVEGDPWSGQMALPGGRGDVADEDALAIAIRETGEEVGLVLPRSSCLGALSDVRLGRRGLNARGILSPYVFVLAGDPPSLSPNHEVNAAFWIPLSHLWDPAASATHDLMVEGESMAFPGIRFGDEIIWGLTYRVLCLFAAVLGRPLPGGVY